MSYLSPYLNHNPPRLGLLWPAFCLLFTLACPHQAWAATFTAINATLSNNLANTAATSHTLDFTTATTADVKQIDIRYSTESGGASKPGHLDLSSASLGTLTNLGTDWNLDNAGAASGLLRLTREVAINITADTAASLELDNITNSAIDDCQSSNDTLTDTCHIRVLTYSDDGVTLVDSGTDTYTVREEPFLNFVVEGLASGQTYNGITTTETSQSDSLSFGRLPQGQVKYMAQKITVSTNAPHGYLIYAHITNQFSGSYGSNQIDPFGATNAAWDTPQLWSSPDGVEPNNDSGWFGGNTTDTRVTGWSSGSSGKFGPISLVAHIVAQSNGPDRGGSIVYISYAVEVNNSQSGDIYSDSLVYNVRAIY